MKKKRLALLLSVVLTTVAVALGGCAGDKQESTSQITIGIPQDIEDSLDPMKATAAGTKEILFNIYEGLVKPDSDGNLIPAVASEYKISEEGRVYTFTLREDIKFHDGSSVTADDVVYSLERYADGQSGDALASAFSNIDDISAPTDKTVVIVLKEANTDFLSYLTAAVIPKSNADPDTVAIGTGPYRYVSRSPQENIILESFDDYWDKDNAPQIKKITLKIIANADTIVTELNGGSIDMFCRLSSTQVSQLSSDYNVYTGTMNLVQALYLNNAIEPFNDVRVRQALCYAIDPQGILDMAFDGQGSIIGSAVYPTFGKYYMPELADAYPTNIEKAKELLAEAGYPDGFTFSITVPSNYQPHVDTAQVIAEQLKEVGITANINLVEWATWLSDVYSGRQYETTVIGVDASMLSAGALLDRYRSDASGNFMNFNSPAYDAAIDAAESSVDDDAKTAAYKQCEQIISDEAASVYIQDMVNLVALNNKYEGYVFYPLYVQDFAKLRLK
ncbi:MAG: ABC transporter substrate-binding protein [Lachnospiraceae bacterium]|nr:ABC transporter substrate-binding protein [Lachnospiraceae bacterium]